MSFLSSVFLALLALTYTSLSGAAHITDKLVVGLYAEPEARGTPLHLLSSGTPVEVLRREGKFAEVRMADDRKGWVEAEYVTDEKPAKAILLETQARLRQMGMQLAALREKQANDGEPVAVASVPAPSAREAQLQQSLSVAESRVAELEQRVADQPVAAAAQRQLQELRGQVQQALQLLADAQGVALSQIESDEEQGFLDRYLIWIIGLGAVVLGFGMGVALIDYRIRKRYGGFRI